MGFSEHMTWQDLGGELEAVAVLRKHARGLRCGRRVVTGDKNSKHIVDELDSKRPVKLNACSAALSPLTQTPPHEHS